MDKEYNTKILQKVPRMWCIRICGAMGPTPTRALETILYLHPIDIQIRYEPLIRLYVMNEWTNKDHEAYHKKCLRVTMGESMESIVWDRMGEKIVSASCETSIPTRDSWFGGFLSQMPTGNCCYTDGSVLDGE